MRESRTTKYVGLEAGGSFVSLLMQGRPTPRRLDRKTAPFVRPAHPLTVTLQSVYYAVQNLDWTQEHQAVALEQLGAFNDLIGFEMKKKERFPHSVRRKLVCG